MPATRATRKPPALVLFSGGLDSTLALAWTLREGHTPTTLEFETPKRPPGERLAADRIARHYHVRDRIRLPWPLDAPPRRDGYLPSRNLVLHSIAYAFAEERSIPLLVAGHLRSDDFPDATKSYLRALNRLANRGREAHRRTRLALPIHDWDTGRRRDAIRRWDVPTELTWSCWWGPDRPCGRCEKCRSRLSRPPSSATRPRTVPRPRTG